MKKILFFLVILILLLLGGFFYFRHQVYFSHGNEKAVIVFEVKKGEGNAIIASNLESKKIISHKFYFYYYIYTNHLLNKIMPGVYMLSGNLSIPEVAHVITNPEAQAVKLTFPEGLTTKDMAELLKKNNFDGAGFLQLVNNIPDSFRTRYAFLTDTKISSLEGYLFPDTYFFKKDLTAESIAKKMLDNFENRIDDTLLAEIKTQNKKLNEVIILASIVEKEVPTAADMKIVAGIFENRLDAGMPLQSDATLSYVLDDTVSSHTIEQTKIASPYNTYANKGLPPGPIANPGMQAILAVVSPQKSDYAYFLTAGTGADKKTYYAKTYDEHLANKQRAGL
ncbi:MAG: endolytic transglycosylase MltG [Candidatus Moranbacteria bacterium]|nr:endolytic transglycosylase MltG [Candidatus Moranbacteria bacterium]